ncbi:peptidoglycan editing factor PgeF [cf. Phormidesmis sp. LEGE 11477]|uniref:peptidoglycan editing factor PgeF n=1 Tax=cf. Phormidesmis sp. LEGE 11477 TaxID=1828680 RepID=UPI00187E04FB|nr:peptidoglycan editing factor PgeF [cf. Phormidesmis sp. LEGE 11477]MBE9064821.1 peptidoglycan editing factor PgeF [cf. Phormidesmis sp. LEGE 11477]
MSIWTWQSSKQQPEKSFLTCALLPCPHGFFTKQFYPQAPVDLAKLISSDANVYQVKQVHSADVLLPSEIELAIAAGLPHLSDGTVAPFPLADGIVTEKPNQMAWACSADCTPALIGDVKTGQVAAVHAGWRGTAQKILPNAIACLQAQGSQLQHLRVALGPAIDGSVYQVGRNVAIEVGKSVAPNLSDQALIEHLMAIDQPPLLDDQGEGKLRLDVRRINQMQLVEIGIEPEWIAIAPHCTYQEPDRFFSYRRTKEKKVQWAGIVST